MTRRRLALWLACAGLLSLVSTACLTFGRTPDATAPNAPAGAPTTAPTPAKPEMKILKLSGAGGGQTNAFAVKLQWSGDKPTAWVCKQWTLMRDKTGQTQSMLVLEEQTFQVPAAEPYTAVVKAIPIDPAKEAQRNLVVDYPGMPIYELVEQYDNPKIAALRGAMDKANKAFADMMPLIRFVKDSIQYAPKDRAKIEPWLELAVWDLSGDKPRPYIEPGTIEAAFVVAFADGMTAKDYANFLQKKSGGINAADALREANRLAPRVNRLLELATLDARLRR